jgi:Tfp pilus assembly protein PilE
MKNKGFYLEIILILLVLGVLGWITSNQFLLAEAKSRDVERKSELHEVSKAIKLYYKDYGKLPSENLINSLWGKEWKDGDYVYMAMIPKEDYLKNKEYCYQTSDDGKQFYLLTDLENKGDTDCSKDLWTCSGEKYCYRDQLSVDELSE